MTAFHRLLLCVLLEWSTVNIVSGIPEGGAPKWMVDLFCDGRNGIAAVPWDCKGYLYCFRNGLGAQGHWFKCQDGLYFDQTRSLTSCNPSTKSCLSGQEVASLVCPTFPTLKFPHPDSCAMYYDCSQEQAMPEYGMKVYENECKPQFMFDLKLGDCRTDNLEPEECINKPTSRADYRMATLNSSQECLGLQNGLHPNPKHPPFTPYYITCQDELLVAAKECVYGRVFDPVMKTCVIDFTASLMVYCQQHPYEVFPDHWNCARYYNCSQARSEAKFQSNLFMVECQYAYLYDTGRKECVVFDQMSKPCGHRFEPINPCDYKVGQCLNRKFCIPCGAKCENKPDGANAFPGLINTRFHLICRGGRTMDILGCPDGEIYNQDWRKCEIEKDETAALKPTQTEAPAPVGCQCMDTIDPLTDSLKNLSTIVDQMKKTIMPDPLPPPYDCVSPPTRANSYVELKYYEDHVTAQYTCIRDHAHCYDVMQGVCRMDDEWDMSTVQSCHRNVWTDTNTIDLPCILWKRNAILFRGRPLTKTFDVSLKGTEDGVLYLYMQVTPEESSIQAGSSKEDSKTIELSTSLLQGEMTWVIEIATNAYKIYVNGEHIATVDHKVPTDMATLEISGGFYPEEIRFQPRGLPKFRIPLLDYNLALEKTAFASDSFGDTLPESAIDGFSNAQPDGNSCWAPKTESENPWWYVDLGKEYLVSHLIITTMDCPPPCPSLSNFGVLVTKTVHPPGEKHSPEEVCLTYDDIVRPGDVRRFDCVSQINGRYVEIVPADSTGQIAFCEVEVYGGLKEETAWTPFSCPDPPLMKGSSVSLSYTENEAVAKYTCHGSSIMCSVNDVVNDVIRCKDLSGWDGVPEQCLQTEVEGYALNRFEFCRLTLGSAIEFWMRPLEMSAKVKIKIVNEIGDVLGMTLNDPDGVTLSIESEYKMLTTDLIKAGKEAHVVITALTGYLLIEVNGEELTEFNLKGGYVHNAHAMTATDEAVVSRVRFHPAFATGVVRERVSDHSGNLMTTYQMQTCLNGEMGSIHQQVVFDLWEQYYITEVKVGLIRPGEGVEPNLALDKQTVASLKQDAMSYVDATTDGSLENNKQAGQCYTSASVPSPYLMVDLGEVKTIRSVALQLPSVAQYGDQFLNLVIAVYTNKPTTNSVMGSTICMDLKDFTSSETYVRFPCLQRATGQFVKISKNTGGQNGLMSLCEVEVYENLEIKSHDVTVNIYEEDPSVSFPMPKLCQHQAGDLPKDAEHTFPCVEGVWGQHVEIRGDIVKDNFDYMTVCNVKVYGDRVTRKGWTLADCPPPPPLTHAVMSVSTGENIVVAQYQCLEGYATCSDRPNTLVCDSQDGWTDTPRTCHPLTLTQPSSELEFCPLTLGRSFEMYFTPLESGSFEFYLGSGSTGDSEGFHLSRSSIRYPGYDQYDEPPIDEYLEDLPLATNKESRMVVTLLSFAHHVDIDGVEFYVKYPSYRIRKVTSGTGIKVRQLRLLDKPTDVIYGPYQKNLALKRHTLGSHLSPDTFPVDGNLFQDCWSIDGETGIWWQVCLFNVYYVTHVMISTSDEPDTTADFRIELFYTEPRPDEVGDLCLHYEQSLPVSETTNLTCWRTVYGRYLRVSASDTADKFSLCEVQVFGGVVLKAEEPRNLALLGSTWPESGYLAVDGHHGMTLSSLRCWVDEKNDRAAWMVELDDLYYITHVQITSIEKCLGECSDILRDFDIRVYMGVPTEGISSPGQLCLHYKGLFPPETQSLLKCTNKHIGKAVAIVGPPYGDGEGERFALCEVVIHGERVGGDPNSVGRNLALDQAVQATSGAAHAAVDDERETCWSATKGDAYASMMVELEEDYVVTEVVVVLGDCGPTCDEVEWDFEVFVYSDKPEIKEYKSGEVALVPDVDSRGPGYIPPVLCATKQAPTEVGKEIALTCGKRPTGRYVKLNILKAPNPQTNLVCDLRVLGERLINEEWSPSDCPVPPHVPYTCVSVCHDFKYPVATYTCSTNYTMCSGSNTLTCDSKAGWTGELGECIQTTWEVNPGQATLDVKEFPICYAELGGGYEAWLTPKLDGCSMKLISRVPGMYILFKFEKENSYDLSTSGATFGIPAPLHDEVHVQLIFLTYNWELLVNGDSLYKLQRDNFFFAQLYHAVFTDECFVRMFRPVARYPQGITRVAIEDYIPTMAREDNIAVFEDVEVSSSTGQDPRLLTDGDTSLDPASCWRADQGQEEHFVRVDLGEYVFIREVVLSTRNKGECSICDDNTHDFTIHGLSTKSLDEHAMLCAFYEGGMPLGSVARINCRNDVYGWYLQITSTFVTGQMDRMTFCEIEVYGDHVIKKIWTVRDCPPPPTPRGIKVLVSYSDDTAFATYTCSDEGYSMCTEFKPLECTDSSGWKGDIAECVQTTLVVEHYGKWQNAFVRICPFQLGKGIELSFIPSDIPEAIALYADGIRLQISMQSTGVEIKAGKSDPILKPTDVFTPGRETTVRILYLSNQFLILVDGEFYASYKHYRVTPLIDTVAFNLKLRNMKPLERYIDGIVRRPVEANLAEWAATEASSDNGTPEKAVDGDLDKTQCWFPSEGDRDQWYQIDLKGYYFIRKLVITTRDNDDSSNKCDGCDGRTHDVAIDVKTNLDDYKPQRCAFHHGAMADAASTRILCETPDVWGRFVRLSKGPEDIKDDKDLLTLCEVEIYGDEVANIEWTVRDCPPPPTPGGTKVLVSYSDDTAFATYTCSDEGYSMCTESKPLECTDSSGWKGDIAECVQTTLVIEPYGKEMVTTLYICPIQLGKGIELSFIPSEIAEYISLKVNNVIALKIDMDTTGVKFSSDSYMSTVLQPKDVFKPGRETTMRILYLTKEFLVLVDGEFYVSYSHFMDTPLSTLEMSLKLRIMKPLGRYIDGIVRRPVEANLAEGSTNEASTQNGQDSDKAVDGNLDKNICWFPSEGDPDQWYKIDLNGYYFIRELVITTRDNDDLSNKCDGCDGRTHDVAIDVVTRFNDKRQRCAFHHGAMADAASTRILCETSDVWGRYVRLSKGPEDVKDDKDLLTFCEVEIYGDEVADIGYGRCAAPEHTLFPEVTPPGVTREVSCVEHYKPCMAELECTSQGEWYNEFYQLPACGRYKWLYPALYFKEPLLCGERDIITFTIVGTPTAPTRCNFAFTNGDEMVVIAPRYGHSGETRLVTSILVAGKELEEVPDIAADSSSEFPFAVGKQFLVVIKFVIDDYTFEALYFNEPLLCGKRDIITITIVGTPTAPTRFSIEFIKGDKKFQIDARIGFQGEHKLFTSTFVGGHWLVRADHASDSSTEYPFAVGKQFFLVIKYTEVGDFYHVTADGLSLGTFNGLTVVPERLFIHGDVHLALVQMENLIDSK